MAKIYTGNMEAADKGLFEALRRLGDNYHVFVEFQIPNPRGQRQVDFLVIRADNVKPCMFMLEVKNERRRLRGTINGPWEYEDGPGYWRTLPVSNPRDQNPIQQAYNTARTMQSWLSSMRALIQDPEDPWPDVPTVFPRLVLPVAHPDNQLQTDSFTWRFDGYERTLDSLLNFIPRDPVPLSVGEIERMAQHLGVKREPDARPARTEAEPSNNWMRAALDELMAEVSALRREVHELRITLNRPGNGYSNRSANVSAYRQSEPQRDIEPALLALTDVIHDLKESGRKLVFPNVQEGLWRRLGDFNVEDYGFFKFKEFLQEAERRGIVALRIVEGVDYVSLPGDDMPVGMNGGPSSLDDLNLEERHRFIESIAELESRSAYMIRSYIARHLTSAAVLPLPMYEVRALVNDAVNRGLFRRGTRPFRHPATGEMQSLETLTLEMDHPWVIDGLRLDLHDDEARADSDEDNAESAPRDWRANEWAQDGYEDDQLHIPTAEQGGYEPDHGYESGGYYAEPQRSGDGNAIGDGPSGNGNGSGNGYGGGHDDERETRGNGETRYWGNASPGDPRSFHRWDDNGRHTTYNRHRDGDDNLRF